MLKPQWVLQPIKQSWIIVERRKEERITKMALSLPHNFAFSCLPQGCWATIWVLQILKTLQRKARCLNKLLAYCGQVTWLLLKYCIFVCQSYPYIESLLTDIPFSEYFILGCNFCIFHGRVGSAKKLLVYSSTTAVFVTATIAILRRQLPNSKISLSWFTLLLSVTNLAQANPQPLAILVCMPLMTASIQPQYCTTWQSCEHLWNKS